MNQLTDIELINLARNDDEDAKNELFKRSKDVISYSVRKTKIQCWGLNSFDVEDIISECHIAVMEAIKLYNPEKGAGFPHFLKFVIRTKLYKITESRIADSKILALDVDLRNVRAAENIMRDLTIKTKNKKQEIIVGMYLTGGFSQTDIAEELGITKGYVHNVIKECIK